MMDTLRKEAFYELKRREREEKTEATKLKEAAIAEIKERVLTKIEADKKAIEDSITEKTLLKDLKGLISDAIPKLQSQNELLIKTAIASFDKEDANIPVIKALQLQTKEIINTLEQLGEKASKTKWTLKTENIERGRDGKIVSMEVSAVQI